jgi:hypothetical protein
LNKLLSIKSTRSFIRNCVRAIVLAYVWSKLCNFQHKVKFDGFNHVNGSRGITDYIGNSVI